MLLPRQASEAGESSNLRVTAQGIETCFTKAQIAEDQCGQDFQKALHFGQIYL